MTDDILIHTHGRVGHISLNRPKALHALTLDMCHAMSAALSKWADDDQIEAVILDHAEGRGFCAGGDINLLRHSALNDGGASGRKFFHDEYQLNHQMMTYAKPIVAFMDGVTMGGGVGIALPCKYRVATENTRFAMPETGIGLFPDVGGGWHLSRLGGRLGQFLALTGARLDGAECLWASLEAADTDWAAKERDTLGTKSPQTCKVALRQLKESADLTDFADNMRMEYRIASRVLVRPDFAEGVRAVIVDKTNDPKWNPPTPEDVSEELLDSIFAPLPEGEEWTPLSP